MTLSYRSGVGMTRLRSG